MHFGARQNWCCKHKISWFIAQHYSKPNSQSSTDYFIIQICRVEFAFDIKSSPPQRFADMVDSLCIMMCFLCPVSCITIWVTIIVILLSIHHNRPWNNSASPLEYRLYIVCNFHMKIKLLIPTPGLTLFQHLATDGTLYASFFQLMRMLALGLD